MKRLLFIPIIILSMCISGLVFGQVDHLKDGIYARIETVKGNILISLEFEKAPMTVANFVGLAEGTIKNDALPLGTPYYDGQIFHRIAPDTLVQAGDPKGNGQGGPGYTFPNEIDHSLKHNGPGILSMANRGRDTNGSQFFITMKALPMLNGLHPVFGKVVSGMEVVEKLTYGDKINRIKIFRKGEKAKNFKADTETFIKMIETAKRKR